MESEQLNYFKDTGKLWSKFFSYFKVISRRKIRSLQSKFHPKIKKEKTKNPAISVWRPLRGPLNDWPLGLCDAQAVDFRNDIMAGDIVYEDFVTENLQVMHNMDQKWFYLPDQTTKEVRSWYSRVLIVNIRMRLVSNKPLIFYHSCSCVCTVWEAS